MAKHKPAKYEVASKPELCAKGNGGKKLTLRIFLMGIIKIFEHGTQELIGIPSINDSSRVRFELLRTMLGVTEICIKMSVEKYYRFLV